jgi:phage FluMu protein Com
MQLGGKRRGDTEHKPPRRMCDECLKFLNSAKTQEVSCEKCGTVITWTKEHQLHVRLGTWVKPSLCADCRRAASADKREAQVQEIAQAQAQAAAKVAEPASDAPPEAPSSTPPSPAAEPKPVGEETAG